MGEMLLLFARRINRGGHFQAKSGRRSTVIHLPTCRSRGTTLQVGNFLRGKLETYSRLLAPQSHNDLLVATRKNDAPVFNGLELDLIILRARLQTEVLAFLHGFAVDNREVRSLVDGDGSKEEG